MSKADTLCVAFAATLNVWSTSNHTSCEVLLMGLKLALKRLSRSDLTFFEWQFRHVNAGNQKSINLNRVVLVDQFYPSLPDLGVACENEFPVAVRLFGPGLKGMHCVARKVTKGTDAYKNWRLNGEFVRDPDDDQGRYSELKQHDLALMAFYGEEKPEALGLFLLSRENEHDAGIYDQLNDLVAQSGPGSMRVITPGELASRIASAKLAAEHPLHQLFLDPTFDEAVEDAILGGDEGVQKLLTRKGGGSLSPSALAKAKLKADRVGQEGEGLVDVLLRKQLDAGELRSVEWTSRRNAISPFDFKIVTDEGKTILIDAKSTEGSFERAIHLSFSELRTAAGAGVRYDIYRVFGLGPEGGCIRVCRNIKPFADGVLAALAGLPEGVSPDGFTIETEHLDWGDEIQVEWPNEE